MALLVCLLFSVVNPLAAPLSCIPPRTGGFASLPCGRFAFYSGSRPEGVRHTGFRPTEKLQVPDYLRFCPMIWRAAGGAYGAWLSVLV